MGVSDVETGKIADALDVLSKCDLIVGRVSKNRHWTLLKYLPSILSYGLFYILTGEKIKYNQYSLPWPISAPIIARRHAVREFLAKLADETHTSVSTLSATYLHYLFNILLQQKIDLRQFVESLNLDSKFSESLFNEITRPKV
jgi:hypothetical protein